MATPREVIMSALFAKLAAATQPDGVTPMFLTTSRRLKLWSDVPLTMQPAMFLVDGNENRVQQPPQGLPSKLDLLPKIVVYAGTADPNIIPASLLNNALDAIDTALLPDDLNRNIQTLTGLVYRCWIEGTIIKNPGDLDGQAMAVIPLHLLIP